MFLKTDVLQIEMLTAHRCTLVHIGALSQISIVEHLVHIRCIWCISTHIGAYWYP